MPAKVPLEARQAQIGEIARGKRKNRDEPVAQGDAPIEGRISTDKKGRTAASARGQRESEAAAPARLTPWPRLPIREEDLLPDDESRALWHSNPAAVREKMRTGLHQALLGDRKRIGVTGVRELAACLGLLQNARLLSPAQHDVLFDLLGEELRTQQLRQVLFERLKPDHSLLPWPEGRTVERVIRLLGDGLATVLGDKLEEFVLALPHADTGDCACLGFFRALHPGRQAATIIHIAEQLAARAHTHNGADAKLRLLVSVLGGNAMEPALLQGICTRLRDPRHHANSDRWLPALSAGLARDGQQPNLSILKASLLGRPDVPLNANVLLLGAATPQEALGKVLVASMGDVLPSRTVPDHDYQRLVHDLARSCSREALQQTIEQNAHAVAQQLADNKNNQRRALITGLANAWVEKQLPLLPLAHLLAKPRPPALSPGTVVVILTWCQPLMIDTIVRELADTPLEEAACDALARHIPPRPPGGEASDTSRYADGWLTSLVRQVGLTPQPALVHLLQRVIASVNVPANFPELLALQLAQATLEGITAVGRVLGKDLRRHVDPYQAIDWLLLKLLPGGLSPANYSALLESTIAGIRETFAQHAATDRNITRILASLQASVGEGPHAGPIDDLGRQLAGEAGWAQACRLKNAFWNNPHRFSIPAEDFPAERMDSLVANATLNPAAGPPARPTTDDLKKLVDLRRPQYDFHDWVAEGVAFGLRCVAAGMSEADCAALVAHRLRFQVLVPHASVMDDTRADPITAGLLLAWKLPTERALEMVLQPLVPAQGSQAAILSVWRTGVASVAWSQPGARDAIAAHAFKALVRVGVTAKSASPSAFAMFDACLAAAGAPRRAAVHALVSPPFGGYDEKELRNQILADLVRTQPEQDGREALSATIATGWSDLISGIGNAMSILAATEPGRRALLKAGRTLEISQLIRLVHIDPITRSQPQLALMARLSRCNGLLTETEVARWSMALTLAVFCPLTMRSTDVDAAKAAFSNAAFDPSPADPALLAICHQSVELAARPWRLATHATAVGDGIQLMKSIYTALPTTREMHECVSLLDDTDIAPGQRLHILSQMAHLFAPKLSPAELLYLGRKGHELLDAHVDAANAAKAQAQKAAAEARKTRGKAEAVSLENDEQAQPTDKAESPEDLHVDQVQDLVDILGAFASLEAVAWIYGAEEAGREVSVETILPRATLLRRLRADLRALCALGSQRPESAPHKFLHGLLEVTERNLSAPLDKALDKLAKKEAGERAKTDAAKDAPEKGKTPRPPVVPPQALERLFERPAPAQPARDGK